MKLKYNKPARIIACVMFFISVITAALSGFCAVVMADNGVYADGGIMLREDVARSIFHSKSDMLTNYARMLYEGEINESVRKSYEAQLSRNNCNLSIMISASDGTESAEPVIYYNYLPSERDQYKFTTTFNYSPSRADRTQITIVGSLRGELTAKDAYYYLMPLTDFLISVSGELIWVAVILAVLAVALLVFMLYSAGCTHEGMDVRLRYFDRIPLDVLFGIYFIVFILTLVIADEFVWYGAAFAVFLSAAILIWLVLAVCLLMSLSVRIKSRTVFKNTLILRLLKLLWRGLVLLFGVLAKFPLYFKAALIFVAWWLMELLFLAIGYEEYLVMWFITRPIIMAAIVYLVLMLRRLEKAGEELAAGNTNYRADTRYMLPTLRRHADNLGSLSEGLSCAVEERMKSERMKSELITNVSHDIKTPLTSIINYVDLLKLNGMNSPDAPEYLEVLEKQSAKLKKLTEDLIEASKAASGCIGCELEAVDACVLLGQAFGEYEDRLREAGIEPILRTAAENAHIMADGRLLFRVFDNLFSNIRKYAMPSSRAYFSCEVIGNEAVITFRNISATPLDMSADELTERFVRGDGSRHTEGSGLGLSIAKSLTELQGGRFDIITDGDLFKVTVTFELISIELQPVSF